MGNYVFKGKKISCLTDERAFPSGNKSVVEIVKCPNAVVILPLIDEDTIVLLRQYRPVIEEWIYELPAGSLEESEEPSNCVLRELKEETGYTANNVKKMFDMYMAPGYSVEMIHSYLAKDLTSGDARPEKDEEMIIKIVSVSDAIDMIRKNVICDAKSIASILYYNYNK